MRRPERPLWVDWASVVAVSSVESEIGYSDGGAHTSCVLMFSGGGRITWQASPDEAMDLVRRARGLVGASSRPSASGAYARPSAGCDHRTVFDGRCAFCGTTR